MNALPVLESPFHWEHLCYRRQFLTPAQVAAVPERPTVIIASQDPQPDGSHVFLLTCTRRSHHGSTMVMLELLSYFYLTNSAVLDLEAHASQFEPYWFAAASCTYQFNPYGRINLEHWRQANLPRVMGTVPSYRRSIFDEPWAPVHRDLWVRLPIDLS